MAKIVIISHFTAPQVGSVPYRISNFVKFFVEKGHNVILISGQRNVQNEDNYGLIKLNLKNEGLLKRTIEKLCPDLIIYSVPPDLGIKTMENLSKKGYNIIFDTRSPLSYNYKGNNILKKKLLSYYEKSLIKHSRLSLINSAGVSEIYRDLGVEKIFYFLPNGYNSVLFDSKRKFTGRFLFFGEFNTMRSIPNFTKFFTIYKSNIIKKGYSFDFYCFQSSELNEVKKVVQNKKFKFIHFYKPITSEKFRNKLKDYSVGLTFLKTIYNYTLPSKFFTYLALGIPTMNISFGRSIISRISREHRLGFDVNPEIYNHTFFDDMEKNYSIYAQSVLDNREIFDWNKMIEEFYNLDELKWLR